MWLFDALAANSALLIGVAIVLGLLLGSFFNVVIYRLPIMLQRNWRKQCYDHLELSDHQPHTEPRFNLIVPRSRCPHCQAPIKAWQNLPVISFLFLKGQCAQCQASIGWRYPLVELATALLTGFLAWQFGFGWPLLAAWVFAWSLLVLTMIDFDHQLLPDSITLPLLWLGLLLSLFHQQFDAAPLFPTPTQSILGAAVGYLSLWGVFHAFKLITGKEGMGYGDFKLLAALGAWLGVKYWFLLVLLSAGLGALVGTLLIVTRLHGKDQPMPFGPFLALAGIVALLWGPPLMQAYLGTF